MTELERELVALGAVLDAPSDEQLVTRVRAVIAQPPASRLRRRLLIAAAAAVLGGAGFASAPVVADWLGVGGVEVRQERPPVSVSPGRVLRLGQRSTLAEARGEVDFDLAVPAELGAPDEVWVDRGHAVPIVWMAYLPRPGLPEAKATGYGALFAQARALVADEFWATKLARPETIVESVDLGTGRALWVQGTHHLALREGHGYIIIDELRLSDNVLLWERGDVTLRFESALGRADSLRIARSAR